MKKIISISLLSLAVNILLLHSFVPHHHSPENFDLRAILRKEPVKSPIDLLKVGFHLNLGSNHLENFQKSKSVALEKKATYTAKLSFLDLLLQDVILNLPTTEEFQKAIFLGTIGSIRLNFIKPFTYRGPPQFA